MQPKSLDAIRVLLQEHPRLCGYYLVGAVSLPPNWRAHEETALTRAFEALDDKPWKPTEDRPTEHRWTDYEVSEPVAKAHAIEMLIGGPEVGHTDLTMSELRAQEIWQMFRGLFTPRVRFFKGLALGDSKHVFLSGVVVADETIAACLCVIESD
jgi:hypothetical protein